MEPASGRSRRPRSTSTRRAPDRDGAPERERAAERDGAPDSDGGRARDVRRPLLALLGGVLPIAGWVFGGASAPGCGGSTAPRSPAAQTDTPIPDPGSGPVDCSVTDPYAFMKIEDFEGFSPTARYFGAATGWFTNNEICYPYTQAGAECFDAGMVCYPGSQATPDCQRDGAPVAVWSSCFGTGSIDCRDVDAALAACRAQCLSIQPSPLFIDDPLPAEAIPGGGRCGSRYAMHIKGGPFSNWGGNIGTRFSFGDGGPTVNGLDASAWDGVAVWMRTAPGFATGAKVALADPHTDSQYNMYPPPGATRFCDPNPNCQAQSAQGNMNCYNVGCDKFGAFTPLTEDWRLYLLPFSEMRQGGWGKPWPELDLTQIVSIEVDYTQGTWDFWVDDISLYRRKSP